MPFCAVNLSVLHSCSTHIFCKLYAGNCMFAYYTSLHTLQLPCTSYFPVLAAARYAVTKVMVL